MCPPAEVRAGAVFVSGLAFFEVAVGRLGPNDWPRSSPCAGWTALDVLGHAGAVARFAAAQAQGLNPPWNPPPRPGEDVGLPPDDWWQVVAAEVAPVIEGLEMTAVLDASGASQTVGAALGFPAVDLYVHAWDLVRSTGGALDLPDDVIDFAHEVIDPMPEAVVRNAQALGPPVPAPRNATRSEAFIAWTGRIPARTEEG